MATTKYEVHVSLPASSGLAQTRKIEVEVDETKLVKRDVFHTTAGLSKALQMAAMKLDQEGITSWSLDRVVKATN